MPIVTVQFNLPEENSEFNASIKGGSFALCIYELDQWLRNNYKYDKGEISVEAAETVRNKIREIVADNGLSMENDINN